VERVRRFQLRELSFTAFRVSPLFFELLSAFSLLPPSKPQTESWRAEIKRTTLAKMEIYAIPLAVAGSNPAVDRLPTRRKQTSPKLTSNRRAQPEIAEGKFFI
jgi:hypothetical protein